MLSTVGNAWRRGALLLADGAEQVAAELVRRVGQERSTAATLGCRAP